MKGVSLAALAIGVPLGLMLLINWMGSSSPAPVAQPTAPVQQVPPSQVAPARTKQPLAANSARTMPENRIVDLVPIGNSEPLRPPQPKRPSKQDAALRSPSASRTTGNEAASGSAPIPRPAPATAPSSGSGLADRIEDWLDDWRQRTRQTPDSRREAAATYLAAGEFERAATAFDRLLVQNPNDPDLLMGEAMALTRLCRYEDALPLLMSVLERDPKHVAARYHYGVTLTRLDRREEAIATFKRLLEVVPGHATAMFNLAILQQSMDQLQDAWTTWRALTQQLAESRPPEASSETLPAGGNGAGSEAGLSPNLVCEAWFHRGEVEMAMYQVKDAEQCFLEVTRRTPGDARAWCNLGIARATLAKYDEAVPALHEAIRLEPTLVPAINQLAYVYAARYRNDGRPEDRQAILDLCERSLAIRSQQLNIRSMRDALIEATREPLPGEENREVPMGTKQKQQ